MGDWFLDANDKWTYDANAPSPGGGVTALAPREPEIPRSGFVRDDGSAYDRPSPAQFNVFDEVDSTSIEDHGGPPDDAA